MASPGHSFQRVASSELCFFLDSGYLGVARRMVDPVGLLPNCSGGSESNNLNDCIRCDKATQPARPETLIRQSSFTQRP